ncbi:syntaxin-61-like, partial [Trifolium medium]|nr:syntaxin-61-like [Trifolium medium]
VDELDKAISVASRDPSWYGIDEVEIENRRRWTSNARTQVRTVKKTVEAGKGSNTATHASINGMHRELMRLPDSHQSTSKSNQYSAGDNDDFIESESDRQMLLINYGTPPPCCAQHCSFTTPFLRDVVPMGDIVNVSGAFPV